MLKESLESTQQSLQIRIARNFTERARGLLFAEPLPAGHFLYIPSCRAVHTFGMRYPLTVIFFDQGNHVLRVYQKVKPWRIISCLSAWAVCETTWRPQTRNDAIDVTRLEFALTRSLELNRKRK
jgi:uncharacterized membrane protein (UPF0127 family)